MSVSSPWPRRAAAAALVALPALLMAWSWGQWADPQVDYGREVYAAWRLAAGDVLYRDLAWFNGPLSVYWNAGWMALVGVSMDTLSWLNLGLVYVVAALLVTLVGRWASGLAATAAALVFITGIAFTQTAGVGNYNYIAPYSHEIVHGLVLGLGALAALQRLGRTGRARWAALGGALVGLAFLTKAEVFVAAAGAALTRLALHLPGAPGRGRAALAFVLGALAPPAAAFGLLALALPAEVAARGALGSWNYVGAAGVQELAFYRRMAGLDDPAHHLGMLAGWSAAWVLAAGAVWVVCRRAPAALDGRPIARVLAFAAGAVTCAAVVLAVRWAEFPRPYPLIALLAFAVLARRWAAARGARERAAPLADQLAFVLLSGLLLLKIVLAAWLDHYGFVLALPATAFAVALALDALPRAVARAGGAGRLARAAALGAIVVIVGARLRITGMWFEREGRTLEGRAEIVHAGWRGPALGRVMADLEERLPDDGTVFVVPEGVMVNFLLRRRNPTPYVNFMPPELIFWGEQAVVRALESSPPDAVVVLHKDTIDDYGVPWFGSAGFGEGILSWIHLRYRRVATYGHPPLTRPFHFGAEVWVPR